MKKISFGKLVRGIGGAAKASALNWQPEDGVYPRLKNFDSRALAGKAGLYAVWHLGVRPQWLRVGAAADLGAALSALRHTAWISTHEGNAGIHLAWAFPAPEQTAGMVRFLSQRLKPAFQFEPFLLDQALEPETPVLDCPLPPGTNS